MVGSNRWEEFCEALDKPILSHSDLVSIVGNDKIIYDEESGLVTFAEWEGLQLDLSVVNYAKYIREVNDLYRCLIDICLNDWLQNYVSRCPLADGATVEQVRLISSLSLSSYSHICLVFWYF